MFKQLAVLCVILTLIGCSPNPQHLPKTNTPTTTTVPDFRPELETTHTITLNSLAKLTVDCKYDRYTFSYYDVDGFKRECKGLLVQDDGKEVAFDPDAIADKVMEPSLVPLVIKWTPILIAIDKSDEANRTDYWDKVGEHWILDPKSKK